MPWNVREVLKELGWADGFHVPVANDENKKLEQKIEELMKQKAEKIVILEVAKDRLNALRKHAKKLEDEKNKNQELLCALRNQYDSEMTMLRNVENEKNKRANETKEMNKGAEIAKINTNKFKEDIKTLATQLNELREKLAWEDEAMFAWEEELAREDRTKSLLIELKLQDDEKFNDLEMRRQLLELDYSQQKSTEDREMNILQNMETQLGQCAKLFREETNKQTKLLHEWHDVNEVLKGRDHLIKNSYAAVDKIKMMARENYFELHEKRKLFYSLQKDNTKELADIEKIKASMMKGKQVAEILDQTIKELTGRTNTLHRYMMDTSSKANLQKSKNAELENSIKIYEMKINHKVHSILELQIKLDTLNVDTMTVEQQTKNTEDIYEMGQKVLNEEMREFNRLQVLIYKLRQDVLKLKNKKFAQEQILNNIKQEQREIEKQTKNLLTEYEEHEENLFNKELALEVLGERHTQLIGENLCSELNDKLREEGIEVEKDIRDLKKEIGNYKFQIRILKKDLSDLTAVLSQGKQELDTLGEHGTNLKLILTCGKKFVQEISDEYNLKLIDLNGVKMEASLAQENVKKLENEYCMLEKQKVILDTEMQERKCEIKGQKDEMMIKKKSLLDERSALKKNIEHVNMRIKQIQKRYEITMDLLGKNDTGEQPSVAYFKIKLAQEKHELQEKGDDLEAKINKTEKEILAMENTLRVVSMTNDNYKKNLETVDIEGPEMQLYQKLEDKCFELNKANKASVTDLNNIRAEIKKLQTSIQMYQVNVSKMQQQWKMREKEVEILTRDIAKKQVKLARASKVMKRLMAEVKATKDPLTYKKLALRDIELRLEAERNKSVLQQLAELAKNYFDAAPIVERLLAERFITLPPFIRPADEMSDRTETKSKMSEISDVSLCSISPSILILDPTILLPEEFQTDYKGQKMPRINICKDSDSDKK